MSYEFIFHCIETWILIVNILSFSFSFFTNRAGTTTPSRLPRSLSFTSLVRIRIHPREYPSTGNEDMERWKRAPVAPGESGDKLSRRNDLTRESMGKGVVREWKRDEWNKAHNKLKNIKQEVNLRVPAHPGDAFFRSMNLRSFWPLEKKQQLSSLLSRVATEFPVTVQSALSLFHYHHYRAYRVKLSSYIILRQRNVGDSLTEKDTVWG